MIRNAVDGLSVLNTITDLELFQSDFDEYSVDCWQRGIELFKERRKEKNEYLPYKYLAALVKGEMNKDKQKELEVPKPKVSQETEDWYVKNYPKVYGHGMYRSLVESGDET